MTWFGPLSQFDILEYLPTYSYDFFTWLLGQNEFELQLLILCIFLCGWQVYAYYNELLRSDHIIQFNEEELLVSLINKKNFNYADTITSYFSLIFICNLLGLLPYVTTLTAQFLFTLVLSLLSLLTIWLHNIYDNKILALNHFLPNGAPLLIVPFIILIELVSTLSRVVSLAVRLFANITSGHALLKILASFALTSLIVIAVWKILVIFPILIIIIITVLELLIAFLQTYVFITLNLIYISEFE
jgi:F-type H+-transporting ATPase subunit a